MLKGYFNIFGNIFVTFYAKSLMRGLILSFLGVFFCVVGNVVTSGELSASPVIKALKLINYQFLALSICTKNKVYMGLTFSWLGRAARLPTEMLLLLDRARLAVSSIYVKLS